MDSQTRNKTVFSDSTPVKLPSAYELRGTVNETPEGKFFLMLRIYRDHLPTARSISVDATEIDFLQRCLHELRRRCDKRALEQLPRKENDASQ